MNKELLYIIKQILQQQMSMVHEQRHADLVRIAAQLKQLIDDYASPSELPAYKMTSCPKGSLGVFV